MSNVGKHWGTMAQQVDNDLGDLPDKINKSRRADSGIDHSGEFANNKADSDYYNDRDMQRSSADSGRESADQMDTSVNVSSSSTGKKKRGFFKSFKKIFKRKSRHRSGDGSDDGPVTEKYRTRRSETEIVTNSQDNEPNEKFRRLNSDVSGMSPKKSLPAHNDNEGDDEEKVHSI